MTDVQFADGILDRLKERNPRFQEKAYLFILSSLHHVIENLDQPRHITGAELAEGVRSLAIEQFGLLARTVLEHWGIHSTEHVGEVVFALVGAGILITQDDDRPEDFVGLFDFEDAFDRNYPWTAAG
jgi:uncharacterized repeat protein (TIGR04138 family)